MDNLYNKNIQKLYEYLIERVKSDLINLNLERQEDGNSFLTLSDNQILEVSQDLLNFIVDTEDFQEEVTRFILEKAKM